MLATYSLKRDVLTLEEIDIYGSSRLGLLKPNLQMYPSVSTENKDFEGKKNYELSNHLGNVLAVISDRKKGSGNVNGNYAYFDAVTISATDYYPFGMAMPGRTFNTEGYRYGFNGQERDTELGNSFFTAEYWEYDARIGRRWNRDPVVLPWQSPYAALDSNPIALSDPSGASTQDPVKETDPTYDPKKDTKSNVLAEIEVKAKRPDWQPNNYAEAKTVYTKSLKSFYATDKRQQGWFGASPPEQYIEKIAAAQIQSYYRQTWINGKFGAGELEHWVPLWANSKKAYYMAQIDDLDYKAGAGIHVVLAVADVFAIENVVKNVAARGLSQTAVVIAEQEAEQAAKGVTPSLGPLKNMSGSLDEAAASARTQAYGPTTTVSRRLPKSAQDVQALTEAQAGMGRNLNLRLGDPRYQGWQKWHHSVGAKGSKSVVHYLRDPQTGYLTDFKFK